MQKVLNISEAFSLALHATSLMAGARQRLSVAQIASRLSVSEAHLSKVLQRLGKAGILESTRGPGGGFSLKGPAKEISLLNIYESVEGPLRPAACLFEEKSCGGKTCLLGGLIGQVNREFEDYLRKTRLSQVKDVIGVDGDAQENR